MKFTASEKRLEHEDLHKGSDKGQACFKRNLNLRNHRAQVCESVIPAWLKSKRELYFQIGCKTFYYYMFFRIFIPLIKL